MARVCLCLSFLICKTGILTSTLPGLLWEEDKCQHRFTTISKLCPSLDPLLKTHKWVHGWSSTKSREEWYRQFMSNRLVWNKLVVTEVTASPISDFLPRSFLFLSPRAEKILSRYLCSTCSLTEIYFREEDDFLDWLPLLPVLFVTMIRGGHCKDSTWRSWPVTIKLTGE